MQVVLQDQDVGKTKDEIEQVRNRLRFINRTTEGPARNLSEMMKLSTNETRELLKSALDVELLMKMFPESVLREGDMLDGMPRLRSENEGQHWVQVVTGRVETELQEVYNSLRLVRIPKMAFRILQAMDEQSIMQVSALTKEQYSEYDALREMSWQVLQSAVEKLGLNYAETLMKIDGVSLQNYLKKFKS